jgi:uncharacterized protein with ParB-like and HNH nuclease domain
MTQPHLKLEMVKVKQLVADYRAGRIVIPEFQREYVWKKSKAPKLIDSLYKWFPDLLSLALGKYRRSSSAPQGSATDARLSNELAH